MKQMLRTAVVVGGLALALSACGGQEATPAAAAPAAANDAAPPVQVVNASQGASGSGAPAATRPGVMGQVVKVDGSTITVKDQRQGNETSVVVTSDTKIYKESTVDLASVPTGQTVMAMGEQNGTTFTATQVRVGATGGPGGGPGGAPPQGGPGAGNQPPAGDQPPAGGQQPPNGANGGPPAGGASGAVLAGTVKSASADSLTVETADGQTVQVVLASGGQVTQQVAGALSDITAGTAIMAMGTAGGSTVTAAQIMIIPAVSAQP
ncbi:MAG: hypothetical protein U0X20_15275 [Caldilineaceae bacterium]